MKILGIRLARSIWLIPRHFLNPAGAFIRPIGQAIKTRYQFLTLKYPIDQAANASQPPDALTFENGAFTTNGRTVQIASMAIHGDGIVVDARSSTDDADAFIRDVLSFASDEFGMPPVGELPVRRIYLSEINVQYSNRPRLVDPRLDKLVREIQAAFGSEAVGAVDTLSLQIGNDTTKSPRQLVFRIDREVNTPIEENRFWAQAPLPTDKHSRLLQMIEDLS